MSTRFQDDHQHLWTLAERVLVECPRCRGQAVVLRAGPTFACASCGHHLRGSGTGWAGMATALVNRKCGRCGRQLSRKVRRAGPHPAKLGVHCPDCSCWSYAPASWRPDAREDAYDPHFGFSLWLRTRCAGDVLWAYNEDHLAFLRGYVAATLRERDPSWNASLASRLPKWIKARANRDAALRGIRRLELRLTC